MILEKTHRSSDDFQRFVDILKKRIDVIPRGEVRTASEKRVLEQVSPGRRPAFLSPGRGRGCIP